MSMLIHVKVSCYADLSVVDLLPKHSVGAADYHNEKVNILPSMIKKGTSYTLLIMQKEQVNFLFGRRKLLRKIFSINLLIVNAITKQGKTSKTKHM